MDIVSQFNQLMSGEAASRAAIRKCLASKDIDQAIVLEKKLRALRLASWLMATLFAAFTLFRIDAWMETRPLEYNGFRFFSFVFAALAGVFAVINLMIVYARLAALRKLIAAGRK